MRQVAVPILAILIFLLFWEALVWVNDWPNYKMASPSDLWPAFWRFKWLFLTLWLGNLVANRNRFADCHCGWCLVGHDHGVFAGLTRRALSTSCWV